MDDRSVLSLKQSEQKRLKYIEYLSNYIDNWSPRFLSVIPLPEEKSVSENALRSLKRAKDNLYGILYKKHVDPQPFLKELYDLKDKFDEAYRLISGSREVGLYSDKILCVSKSWSTK